jgi:hypothetical protein
MRARNGRAASRSTASRAFNWTRFAGANRWAFCRGIRCAASATTRARAGPYPLAVPAAVGRVLN